MMTRSVGQATAPPRGGRMGGRTGRGGVELEGNVRNDIENNDHRGYTYREFLSCNPKVYDGKGGAIVYTCCIKKIESVHDMSGCRDNQKVKYTAGSFVGKALTHAAYTDRFHKLARLVPHLVTSENKRIERYVYGLAPQIRGMVAATEPTTIQKAVQIASTLTGHLAKDCKVVPRNVNPVNARNLIATRGACFECGGIDHYKSACPRLNRAQGPGVNCPNQDLSIDGGYGRGNNGIKPSDLRFSYETEIASGQLVEIDKVIKGMDWLSNHKAEIICHEKVVRIPLLDGKVLRVLGERPEEKARHLMGVKAKE
ncbi:hypothetical protein Tco_0727910 [Tanacetum coccineum]|uniref:Ty3 transposon capsid-like protein domain-containing protein n=1 Tax=Tanacetum coccineum TaxID=301880 RepID=A0ABQ4YJM8_9ASTR